MGSRGLCVLLPTALLYNFTIAYIPCFPETGEKNQLMQISSVSSLQGISLLRNSLKSIVPKIEKHHLTRKCSYGKQAFDSFTCFLNTGKASQ